MDKCECEIDEDGNTFWWNGSSLHREDGPAIVWANGDMEWFHYGKTHRVGGPAMLYQNGEAQWYLNDIPYSSLNAWLIENTYLTDEEKIMLVLQYG
jgi:hypothetical protein